MKGDFEVERVTPTVTGWQTVGVVLVLASGSGVVVFFGVGLLALAFGWSVLVACGAAGIAVLVVWLVGVLKVDGLLYVVETARTVADAPPVAHEALTLELTEPERGRWQFVDLPGSVDQLEAVARGVLSGRTLSEAEWTGAGRPYARGEFRELRSQLLERGLLTWRNDRAPSQGVELTAVGRNVFSRIAERPRTHAHVRQGGQVALPPGDE